MCVDAAGGEDYKGEEDEQGEGGGEAQYSTGFEGIEEKSGDIWLRQRRRESLHVPYHSLKAV